jgi:hypothetical protein
MKCLVIGGNEILCCFADERCKCELHVHVYVLWPCGFRTLSLTARVHTCLQKIKSDLQEENCRTRLNQA